MLFMIEVVPIKFHPYTSRTLERIWSCDSTVPAIEEFRKGLIDQFNYCGVHASNDNKIVFECEVNKKRIFYGFYDNKFSIGLDYYNSNERRRQ